MGEQHTKGPLTIKRAQDEPALDYAIIGDDRVLGEAYAVLGPNERAPARANAALWAAAPDLYKACAAVFTSGGYIHLPDDVIWMLRKAIAKAEGLHA